jgi:hypothetical protein
VSWLDGRRRRQYTTNRIGHRGRHPTPTARVPGTGSGTGLDLASGDTEPGDGVANSARLVEAITYIVNLFAARLMRAPKGPSPMSSVMLDVRAPARHSDSADPDQMILTRAVATRYGISVRTLDRWLVKPIAFAGPTMVTKDIIGRVANRYWRLGDLIAWERTLTVRSAEVA